MFFSSHGFKSWCISSSGHSGNLPSKYDASRAYRPVPAVCARAPPSWRPSPCAPKQPGPSRAACCCCHFLWCWHLAPSWKRAVPEILLWQLLLRLSLLPSGEPWLHQQLQEARSPPLRRAPHSSRSAAALRRADRSVASADPSWRPRGRRLCRRPPAGRWPGPLRRFRSSWLFDLQEGSCSCSHGGWLQNLPSPPQSPAVAVAAPRWPPCASHDARHARFGRHALERRRRRCTSDSCGWRRPDASRAPAGVEGETWTRRNFSS
mmetsp:Transcript_42075/g.91308  ORF Transcript_42075/g.91308 Transcript_42075/m.91308 type:complete len:263 (-) Transcript_42075:1200-1988(-)